MKKLNLSIPTPCHENWEQMSQAEKGKFCGACQKTVVDFTAMSDRQLADFFKKPKSDVCGRFNDDQLEREILMPRKRIPWIRYFFQFTWPAFVLGLKSCTNNTMGIIKGEPEPKVKTRSIRKDTIQYATMGFALPEIVPYEKKFTKSVITKCGQEIPALPKEQIDSISSKEDTIISGPPLDTVRIVSQGIIRRVMGGISMRVTAINVCDNAVSQNLKPELAENKFLAYPNPVNAGSMLTVKFPENNIPEKIQLISMSGQIIASIEQDISDYVTICNVRIPSHIASGVYFLRLFSKNKILNTTKIIVNK